MLNFQLNLNQKVDPINFKIVSTEQRKNGSVVIQSESNEERKNIKETMQKKIKDHNQVDMKHISKRVGMWKKYLKN